MATAIIQSLPSETARAARGLFGKGNFYRMIGDQGEALFAGLEVPGWMEPTNEKWFHPFTLFMITVFQIFEGLSDFRAMEAVRMRLDWKYALHLTLDFPGVEAVSLCELRQRLLHDPLALQFFRESLIRMKDLKVLANIDLEPGEIAEAIRAICRLTRLEEISRAFSASLEALASERPDWLRQVARPHWYGQYQPAASLSDPPISSIAQHQLAVAIGKDVDFLLKAISKVDQPEFKELGEIQALRQVWHKQFECVEGQVLWKKDACLDCSFSDRLLRSNSSGYRSV